MGPFKDAKYHSVIKESIKNDPLIPIRNSLGPLGTCLPIENFYSSYHLITHNQILVTNYLQLDNLNQTFQVIKFKYYLMDKNGKFFNPDPCRNIILNPFNLNWSFLHHNYCEETSKIISLGQFICQNVCIAKNGPPLKSVQVIPVQVDSIRVEGWNKCIKRILGIPRGFLIGAELTIAQSRISLVNKIQQVYCSQGVQIHNRHIEIIVRQITSKVLVSEDLLSNVFSPGELIGLLRAEQMGRALEEAICY
ncbi:hypothetical protein P3S68_001596 [Capsicum galapagoense]